jgi:hypothetical protein
MLASHAFFEELDPVYERANCAWATKDGPQMAEPEALNAFNKFTSSSG